METITPTNADQLGEFGRYRKTAVSKISNFTVPPGTTFDTPEGLRAEDEECRVAFDTQGGVYPIRESVFRESYEPDDSPTEPGNNPSFSQPASMQPRIDEVVEELDQDAAKRSGQTTKE